jgi:glycerophosphoryl diester phosphodiesterase
VAGIAVHRAIVDAAVVTTAHDLGLAVHCWTYRAENAFLPVELRSSPHPAEHGDLAAELRALEELGVDGVITDHPDVARAAIPARRPAFA